MKSSASAQFWLIDSDQIHGTMKPMFSIAPSVLGTASVTATSRMKPKITDTTTDMYIPTAAIREAWFVSSAMCAEASKPVIVYCAISRPVANTYQNIGFEKFTSALPNPDAFTVSPKTKPERLVVVGDERAGSPTMKSTPAMCQYAEIVFSIAVKLTFIRFTASASARKIT